MNANHPLLKDLFELETDENLKSRLSTEKEEIKSIIKDKIQKDSTVNKLKGYVNLYTYVENKKDKEKTTNINFYYKKYYKYLDNTVKDFEESFISNYGEKLLELIAADFIEHNRYRLLESKKTGGLPDFEFEFNGKHFYLECTSRGSFLINEYIESMSKFNDYIEIARIFRHENEILEKRSPSWNQKWWHLCIRPEIIYDICRSLNNEDKKKIWNCLDNQCQQPSFIQVIHIEKFSWWIYLNLYFLISFKEILPEKIIGIFNELGLSEPYFSSDSEIYKQKFKDQLMKFIIQATLAKLKKNYSKSNDEKPIILLVSLGTFFDIKMLNHSVIADFIKFVASLLPKEINELSNKDKTEIEAGINNLYAIIINTNLEPLLTKQNNKYYGIIYNKNNKIADEDIKNNTRLFSDLVREEIFFNINNNE